MSKMGSHCSFGHLKHKLWAKERLGVKLAVWLPTTKNRESTRQSGRFPCVQVMCNIPLKIFQRGLQLCFKPHRDQRSAQEIMRPQSRESPGWCNFRTPFCESRDKKPFGCGPPWRSAKYIIRGKVVASPKSGPWWVLCVRVIHGSS
jgi:hypothetical protein